MPATKTVRPQERAMPANQNRSPVGAGHARDQ